MKKSNISMKVIAYTFLIIMAIIFVMPMLFTIISSLKTKLDIFSDPFALPKNPQWSNYVIAWKDANMSAYFINSVIQSGSTVILTSLIGIGIHAWNDGTDAYYLGSGILYYRTL